MTEPLALKTARRLIIELAAAGETITTVLDQALGRITAEALKTRLPIPSFNHSTRDGYAAKSHDISRASSADPVKLLVTGEIAAGSADLPPLNKGCALRIMTGAAMPPGSDLVLAQEDVEIENDTIIVSQPAPAHTFTRRRGSTLAAGRLIVGKGTALAPEHLALLATGGVNEIKIYRRPAVAVICTGSELIAPGKKPTAGQVISGNRLLLDGLIKNCGGATIALETTPDRTEIIAGEIKRFIAGQPPVIITTGGMGPGKFDLMEKVFAELGITTVYHALQVRPGRATMLGVSGKTLIFALPGPPPAVRLLFDELVKPALWKIGGTRISANKDLRAELIETIEVRPGKFLHLQGGICFVSGGKLQVRRAGTTEKINCTIYLPARRRFFKRGEQVAINFTSPQL